MSGKSDIKDYLLSQINEKIKAEQAAIFPTDDALLEYALKEASIDPALLVELEKKIKITHQLYEECQNITQSIAKKLENARFGEHATNFYNNSFDQYKKDLAWWLRNSTKVKEVRETDRVRDLQDLAKRIAFEIARCGAGEALSKLVDRLLAEVNRS